jgi:large subunit ribosomal protein L28
MSRICQLTGKKSMVGNHVSHSNVKTKRRFHVNIQTKRFYIPETQEWVTLSVSTTALRTISKMGLYAYLQKLNKKGKLPNV